MNVSTINSMKKDIISGISGAGWLGYSQILRILANKGYQVEGEAVVHAADSPVVFWGQVSAEFAHAIQELMSEKAITHAAAPIELYEMEGLVPQMPIIRHQLEGLNPNFFVFYPSVLALGEMVEGN